MAIRERSGKHSWELLPSDVARIPDDGRELVKSFIERDARYCMQLYAICGNGAHAWRAWCCARLLAPIPDDLAQALQAFVDSVASDMVNASSSIDVARSARMSNASGARGEGNQSADDQWADRDLIIRFMHLKNLPDASGKKPTPTQVRERLAVELSTTEGAIKQRLLRIEGRGQYASRSRKSR